MAIQFPNFLSVPVRTPDYSGLADIFQNYYAGKAMPKDDMIKAIQAEFARPNAEQSLLSSKLSNRKSQMDINKMAQEMAEQAAFEKQLRQALSGNQMPANMPTGNAGQGGLPLPPVRNIPPMGATPAQTSRVGAIPGVNILGADEVVDDGIDRTKMDPRYRKFDQMSTGLPLSAYKDGQGATNAPIAPQNAPSPQIAPRPSEPEVNETIISKGSPHLAGVDQLYENNPLSRAFLEKKGYKKTTEVKFDNKTGRTTVMTKYPSGKITMQTYGGTTGEGGIPLTNNQVTKHQNVISSVDVALPIVQEIKDLKSYPYNPLYHGAEYATYNGLVSQALDSLIGAFGMPKTNEGLASVREQLERKTFETAGAYRSRLDKLIKDLKKRKEYSSSEVKRTNKISPVDSSANPNASDETYSADEWEAV